MVALAVDQEFVHIVGPAGAPFGPLFFMQACLNEFVALARSLLRCLNDMIHAARRHANVSCIIGHLCARVARS